MDCQDARLLLAFDDRPNEGLDPIEGQALQRHIEACEDCAAVVALQRANHTADLAIGQSMRDVSVPMDLPSKIKQRLAADRTPTWKKAAVTAAAAAAILALMASGILYFNRPTDVAINDLALLPQQGNRWTADEVDAFLEKQGLDARSPRDFNFDWLQHVEVVEFQKRHVAKLSFRRDAQTWAYVLVLPQRQFRFPELPNEDVQANLTMRIASRDGFTYAIFYFGRLDDLLRQLN